MREHDLIRSDDAERLGLGYGPDFLVLSQLWVDGMDVLADYDCGHLDFTGFHAHPAWTDGSPVRRVGCVSLLGADVVDVDLATTLEEEDPDGVDLTEVEGHPGGHSISSEVPAVGPAFTSNLSVERP